MSSHHIVREKQEPALVVLSLDNFTDELLGQLLEWSPTVIVTPQVAEQLNAYGIKIDYVLGDVDLEISQSDIKQISVYEESLTEAALKFLLNRDYKAVNIVTNELALKDILPYAGKINIVIFYRLQKIYAVTSGFGKWKPAGEYIELLSHPDELVVTGLEEVTDIKYITTHDGFFTLQFKQPFVFVAESIL